MLLNNLTLAIKKETGSIIDHTINQKDNKHKYMTNTNELSGCLSRYPPDYMDAETLTEKFTVILCLQHQGGGKYKHLRSSVKRVFVIR